MATDIDFKKSIEYFDEETCLTNIWSIARNKMVLKNILRGYSAALSAGIAIYYSSKEPEDTNGDTLEFIGSGEGNKERLKFFHPICGKYRSCPPQDERCEYFDKEIAMKYYEGDWERPTLYRCHLNIWDMTYPIRIYGVLLGVLFAGQIVVKKGTVKWREVLKEITANPAYQVFWDAFDGTAKMPESSDHIEDIKAAIKSKTDAGCGGTLVDVDEIDTEGRSLASEEIVSRFEDFIKFGEMLSALLNDLYATRKDAAIRRLVQVAAEYLKEGDLSSLENWAKHCEALFGAVTSMTDIKKIHIYTRSHSNYERIIPYDKENRRVIKAKEILESVPLEELINLKDDEIKNRGLFEKFGLGTKKDIWLFRAENKAELSTLASLIVMKGDIGVKYHQLAEFFCRTVCGCIDVVSLIFRLREQQEEFKLKVGEVVHSFRTPLQLLILDIETVEKYIGDKPDLMVLLNESKRRLFGAREDIKKLLEQVKEYRVLYNIVLLVEEVMNTLKPVADDHPCLLVKRGEWSNEVIVRMNKERVRRALEGLIENAIKYSYRGKMEDGVKKLHEVRISIDTSDYDMVMVRITNYGIGIPPYLKDTVLELGRRALVPDSKYERTGTGFGLPIANYIFKEHGGRLEIDSRPADDKPRKAGEEYHRYVTEVRAYLPVYR